MTTTVSPHVKPRAPRRPGLVLAGVLVAALMPVVGCERTLENVAEVYPVARQAITLRWDYEIEGVARVRYDVDGQAAGTGTDPRVRFAITLDTRSYANGPHTLVATAQDGEGRQLRAVTSTFLIENR